MDAEVFDAEGVGEGEGWWELSLKRWWAVTKGYRMNEMKWWPKSQ